MVGFGYAIDLFPLGSGAGGSDPSFRSRPCAGFFRACGRSIRRRHDHGACVWESPGESASRRHRRSGVASGLWPACQAVGFRSGFRQAGDSHHQGAGSLRSDRRVRDGRWRGCQPRDGVGGDGVVVSAVRPGQCRSGAGRIVRACRPPWPVGVVVAGSPVGIPPRGAWLRFWSVVPGWFGEGAFGWGRRSRCGNSGAVRGFAVPHHIREEVPPGRLLGVATFADSSELVRGGFAWFGPLRPLPPLKRSA